MEDVSLYASNDSHKQSDRDFLDGHLNEVICHLREQLQKRKALKFHLILRARLIKENQIDGRKMEAMPAFHSATMTLLASDDIKSMVREAYSHLLGNVD